VDGATSRKKQVVRQVLKGGDLMKPKKFCPRCGAEIEEWQKLCDKCLMQIDEQERMAKAIQDNAHDLYKALKAAVPVLRFEANRAKTEGSTCYREQLKLAEFVLAKVEGGEVE
jgi:predicted amidophosphoribosyltransferase